MSLSGGTASGTPHMRGADIVAGQAGSSSTSPVDSTGIAAARSCGRAVLGDVGLDGAGDGAASASAEAESKAAFNSGVSTDGVS